MPFLFNNANMFIDQNNGIIGIGTNTPTSNLHVIGSSVITGNLNVSSLTITGTGLTGILRTATQPNITLLGTLTNVFINNGFNVSTTGNVGVGIGTAISNSNIHVQGTSKFLSSTGSTGMHINALGNVGIGTALPTGNLHVIGHTQVLGITGTAGLYVSNIGNVGIGTGVTNPQYNLDINGTMRCSNVAIFQGLATQNSTFGVALGMDQSHHCCLQLTANTSVTSSFCYIDFSNIGNDYLGRILYDNLTHHLIFATKTTERLRIDTNGNIGIGTTAPTCNLHVATGYTSAAGIAANIGGSLVLLNGINDGSRFISALETSMSAGSTRYIAFGQSASSLNEAQFEFWYVGSGSTSNMLSLLLNSKRIMSLTGAGYVGIGITNPSYPLYVATAGTTYSGTSRNFFGQSTTTAFGTNGSSSTNVSAVFAGDVINIAGNYVAMSDARLKKDIISLDTYYCLELLLQLRVVEHDYIDNYKFPKKKINFIAQEVEQVIPLAVETVEDYIPSIFNKYSYNKITNTTYLILDIHFNFIEVNTKLKILTQEEEYITIVINITQDTITIKTEKEIIGEIFVYGHQINDCRTLNNDTLYTICIGAVQENNKRIKILEQKIVILEEKLNKLL